MYGILEGVTEWLPVSSTGHLILLSELLTFEVTDRMSPALAAEYMALFEVVIQFGAMLAVLVRFWHRLLPVGEMRHATVRRETLTLWKHLLLASLPAALVGFGADRLLETLTGKGIDGHLFRPSVVAAALIGYGILFLLPLGARQAKGDLSPRDAFGVGCAQTLALIPGTSRSGSILLGARLLGIDPARAAEFSFLLGLPAIGGASLLQGVDFAGFLIETGESLPLFALLLLLLSFTVAFLVSLPVMDFLISFVKRHGLAPFGIYRIALGGVILLATLVFQIL